MFQGRLLSTTKKTISDGWKPNENADEQASSSQFNEWWWLAYKQRLVKAATQIEGVQHVLTATDEWLPFETLRSAYPIDNSCPKPDAR